MVTVQVLPGTVYRKVYVHVLYNVSITVVLYWSTLLGISFDSSSTTVHTYLYLSH